MAIEVSVVLPCLNESETVGICVRKARDTLQKLGIEGEIVVADNGSTDESVRIAESFGARVVIESRKGYGNAYRAGIEIARGHYIVIADSDDSYDLCDLARFIEPLRQGHEFVIGTRMHGQIEKGAMPWHHRYLGNPLLTGLLKWMFHSRVSDAHCGMRSFTRQAYDRMQLQTTGMEYASEMVIKAAELGLRTCEIPITLHRDGRSRPPHLRSFRDGWRHLRFMLLHSPTHLFLIPGLFLFILGFLALFLALAAPAQRFGLMLSQNGMVFGSLSTLLGYQVIVLGIFARIYAVTHEYRPLTGGLQRAFKLFNLERGLLVGALFFIAGFFISLIFFPRWNSTDLGLSNDIRPALFAATLILIGAQTIFSSFFLSILGIERRPPVSPVSR
ncbi:glycosyltransferase family 2 protein [candidate division KSB1 bacterium]|nr:glycosyltransferase family 2 protein [candidate division KSB1 bacterium]